MIPLGDASRRPRRFPVVTLSIIAVNVFVFILELLGGDDFILRWSLEPAGILTVHGVITVFTSMFMHAGWEHIIGNMLFFWVFAPDIEDAMGRFTFLLFYLLGGVVAAVAEVVVNPSATIPSLGASGAIAAVMGAFLITYPRDRIRTVLFFGFFVRVAYVPAVLMIGLWILTQVFSQVGAMAQVQTGGGVAYMAHIGGFIYGVLTGRPFETHQQRRLQGPDRTERLPW
ncbi:MAG TPA: rhomboid family intramembrane serine protease [Spirochaetia bacterium]|nr:rhomboid family intramembrane serine protease [Spirochaetia bacterium]